MTWKEILINMVIPIISAIIGGGMTLWGVKRTLKFENKKMREEIIIANKPLFYIINPLQEYDYKNAIEFNFYPLNIQKEYKGYIFGILRNTEKAILIFDYIQINDEKYYSKYGNIVEKNAFVILHINSKEAIEKKRIFLVIKDILDNQYKYELKKSDDPDAYYLNSFEEIK